jgi:hypothetical protein
MQATPEIGKSIRAGGVLTNYHEAGKGTPVILIHGCKCKLYPAHGHFGGLLPACHNSTDTVLERWE